MLYIQSLNSSELKLRKYKAANRKHMLIKVLKFISFFLPALQRWSVHMRKADADERVFTCVYVCFPACRVCMCSERERGGQKLALSDGQAEEKTGIRGSSKSGELVEEAGAIQHVHPNKWGEGQRVRGLRNRGGGVGGEEGGLGGGRWYLDGWRFMSLARKLYPTSEQQIALDITLKIKLHWSVKPASQFPAVCFGKRLPPHLISRAAGGFNQTRSLEIA